MMSIIIFIFLMGAGLIFLYIGLFEVRLGYQSFGYLMILFALYLLICGIIFITMTSIEMMYKIPIGNGMIK